MGGLCETNSPVIECTFKVLQRYSSHLCEACTYGYLYSNLQDKEAILTIHATQEYKYKNTVLENKHLQNILVKYYLHCMINNDQLN